MAVEVIKNAGFCFGVSRAIELLKSEIEDPSNTDVYTLGEIIHNPDIIDEFSKAGVKIAQNASDVPPGATIVIRAHGVSVDEMKILNDSGVKVVDATCPFVAKIHDIVKKESENGNIIFIGGDAAHPEVEGIKSRARISRVFSNCAQLKDLLSKEPDLLLKTATFVWQTTFNLNEYAKCNKFVKKTFKSTKIYDTICNATELRQKETMELAKKSDVMIIIGGRKSSNANKLYDVAKRFCKNTYFVQNVKEIPIKFIYNFKNIGITAGASTPDRIIEEVKQFMSELTNNTTVNEDMTFEEMLENSLKKVIATGDRVKGIVVGVNPAEVKVDLGTKQSGFITKENFSADSSIDLTTAVNIGDEIDCVALRVNDVEGTIALSKKRVDSMKGYEEIEKAYEEKSVLEAEVKEVTSGGLVIIVNNVRVFIPKSLTGKPASFDLNSLKGEKVQFNIIEFSQNRGRKKIIGSMKAIENEKRKAARKEFWENAAVGDRFEGTVKSLTTFGAFVDLGCVDGLLHITELTWKKIGHPSEVVNVGDKISVYIKDIDKENKKISLGYKDPNADPFVLFTNNYKVGDTVKVKIVSIMPFGAFANITDGVDGLIHISQLSDKRVNKPSDVVAVGDEVEAKIVDINTETRKVGLSMRALIEEAKAAEESADVAADVADTVIVSDDTENVTVAE